MTRKKGTAPPQDTVAEKPPAETTLQAQEAQAKDAPPKDTSPEDRFTLPDPDEPIEDEDYPPDLVLLLFELMDDVLFMEAHIWAADKALQEARAVEEWSEPALARGRAYWLMRAAAGGAKEAARTVHEMHPEVVAYCKRKNVERKEREGRRERGYEE